MKLPEKINSKYQYVETINIKELGIRKKIDVFITKNIKDENSILFYVTQKSRFLQKDVDKLEEINTVILSNIQEQIKEKVILIESPLCSKAKTKLEELDWTIFI